MSLFRLRKKVRDEARSTEQRRRRRGLGGAGRLGLEALEMRLAPAGLSIWDGSSSANWSDPDNWDNAPADGNDLMFPAAALNKTNVNDLSGRSFASLTFSDVGYTISGAAITLTGTLAATSGAGTDVVSLPITLASPGPVNVTLAATTLKVDGVISGTNGLTKQGAGTLTLTANNDYSGTTTVSGGVLQVDGTQSGSPVALAAGTTLRGSGTVGGITSVGATVTPGDGLSPGILQDSGGATLDAASTFRVDLEGTGATQFSQLAASGQVTIGGATLAATVGFTPTANEQFTIINNTGSSAVSGTFAGLPEGGELVVSGQSFQITYKGGDGNDVVLTHLLATSTTVGATPSSSVFGQSVTLTSTVTATGGTGTPTGMVQFFNGTTSLGTAPLNGGTATFLTSALPVGSDAVTAKYLGDDTFASSTSAATTVTVAQASTTTTITSHTPNPSVAGQGVGISVTVAAVAPGAGTPTGTVQFFSGLTSIGSATLSGGVASLTTTALATGSDQITAQYTGDTNFAGSTSPAVTQTVNQSSTTTALNALPNPASAGANVNLTATVAAVAPGSGTPTGTVEFFNGTTSLGTANVVGGVALLTTSTLPKGPNSVTAHFSGDTNFLSSTSPAVTVNVNEATSTSLSVTPTSITFGDKVSMTATVTATAGGGTPTGSVSFSAGTTTLGFAVLDSNGVAKLDSTSLPGGTNSITANYVGDNTFGGSTSNPVPVTVARANTSSTLSASPTTVNQNQIVTLTLTVTSPNNQSPVKPSGTVTFFNGTTSIGTAVLNPSGIATLTTANLNLGNNSITAQFPGDTNYNSSTSNAVNVSVKRGTNTTLSVNPSEVVTGQEVTLTSSVTPSSGTGVPTGTVQFLNGATVLDTVPLVGGVATLKTKKLTFGTAVLTAKYSGDDTFGSTTSPAQSVTVDRGDSSTTVTVTPNPSRFSQLVTLKATVKAKSPASGTPDGNVQFLNGTTPLGTVALVNGVATLTTTALALGSNSITASYQQSTNFNASVSPAVIATVRSSAATVTLTTSKTNPVAFEAIKLTATVKAGAGGTGSPTGDVVFLDNGKFLGRATLSSGVATLATSKTTVGSNTIVAVYQGDDNFTSARSNSVSVNAGDQTEQWLNGVYQAALNRPAQLFELDLWRTQLAIGATRNQVVTKIVNSGEGQVNQVRAVYKQYLRRLPTNNEVILGARALRGTTGFPYEASILGGREYFVTQGHSTNVGFVTALYRDVLGITVPPLTLAKLANALDAGASRTTVALGLVQSQAGKTALVNFFFKRLLGRPADRVELQYYLQQFNRGRSIQQVFGAILASDEYFTHFSTTA